MNGVPYRAVMPSLMTVEHAEPEGHRELAQVGLQLGVRRREVGVLGAGLLELDDRDRHAVEVEHDVEAALVLRATGRSPG